MGRMFRDKNAFNQPIGDCERRLRQQRRACTFWTVRNCTHSPAFQPEMATIEPVVRQGPSRVTNMQWMFQNNNAFDQPSGHIEPAPWMCSADVSNGTPSCVFNGRYFSFAPSRRFVPEGAALRKPGSTACEPSRTHHTTAAACKPATPQQPRPPQPPFIL